MSNVINEDIIPQQQVGGSSDTSALKELADEDQAKAFYSIVKNRLLNVNEWEKIGGLLSADFRLCDEHGKEVNRLIKENDHFKIDVPGPGTVTGDGYDWVQVESIDESSSEHEEMTAIKVRPATNPTNEKTDVAHFFSNSATSSFIIERKNNVITAGVHGRNEKPNAQAEKTIDKARNTAMAAVAITGFSKIQWQGLVDGLVKE
ncbi:MAG: hypothetical protein WKF35_10520 [Ferruginibacter sp.]